MSAALSSALPSSGTFQSQSKGKRSPSNTQTIIIATIVPSTVVIIILVVAGVVFYRRKHSRHPYQYEPPSEPNIVQDPSSSGWVEGAFGRREGSGVFDHPSLLAGQSVPRPLRGDIAARDIAKTRREHHLVNKSSTRSLDTGSNAAQLTPPVPLSDATKESSEPVAAVQMERLGRHPYAARTPEHDQDVSITGISGSALPTSTSAPPTYPPTPNSAPRSTFLSPPTSAHSPLSADSTTSFLPRRPVAGRQRSGSRPLPMRPVLELQAHAARVRRQNSVTRSQSSHLSNEDLPPSYEASRAPHTSR
jgi:hypothetical protein